MTAPLIARTPGLRALIRGDPLTCFYFDAQDVDEIRRLHAAGALSHEGFAPMATRFMGFWNRAIGAALLNVKRVLDAPGEDRVALYDRHAREGGVAFMGIPFEVFWHAIAMQAAWYVIHVPVAVADEYVSFVREVQRNAEQYTAAAVEVTRLARDRLQAAITRLGGLYYPAAVRVPPSKWLPAPALADGGSPPATSLWSAPALAAAPRGLTPAWLRDRPAAPAPPAAGLPPAVD